MLIVTYINFKFPFLHLVLLKVLLLVYYCFYTWYSFLVFAFSFYSYMFMVSLVNTYVARLKFYYFSKHVFMLIFTQHEETCYYESF